MQQREEARPPVGATLEQSDKTQVESLQKVRKLFQFAFSSIAVGMVWREDGGLQPGGREAIRKHQEIKGPRGRGSHNGTVMKIEFIVLVSDCMLCVQRDGRVQNHSFIAVISLPQRLIKK